MTEERHESGTDGDEKDYAWRRRVLGHRVKLLQRWYDGVRWALLVVLLLAGLWIFRGMIFGHAPAP